MDLVVSHTGEVRGLYSEAVELACLGPVSIRRASYVEPLDLGEWAADLGPVAGPQLGPFAQRSAALAAEEAWLRRNWLGIPG